MPTVSKGQSLDSKQAIWLQVHPWTTEPAYPSLQCCITPQNRLIQCCLEAASAWKGTHGGQKGLAQQGSPFPGSTAALRSVCTLPCVPLSSFTLHLVSGLLRPLLSHRRRCLSSSLGSSPSASALHSVSHLLSLIISPLSRASNLLPWLLSHSWQHVQDSPHLI